MISLKTDLNPQTLEDLLRQSSSGPTEELPGSFAAGVVWRAKRLQVAARAHWRALALGSLAAMLLSLAIGLAMAHSTNSIPPSLFLFQAGSPSQPFDLP